MIDAENDRKRKSCREIKDQQCSGMVSYCSHANKKKRDAAKLSRLININDAKRPKLGA